MFKLVFENSKGESIELFSHPYRLMRVDGLGDVGVDVQTQKVPFQDGESLIDTVLEPRYMQIEVKIIGDNLEDVEAKRRRLASVFNPKLQLGTLRYIRGDMIREIDAVAETVPAFPDGSTNRGRTFQKAVINLIAPNPYWKSPIVTEEPMAAFVPLFEFPSDDYWFEDEDGNLYFEVGTEGERRTFVIEGDAEVPVKITFHGPSVNPEVRNNTTGEYIRVNRTLGPDDVLFIDTSNATVEINGQNVFNWIDLGSTFWKLQVGANEIQYTADSGKEEASLIVEWQERFISV